MRSHPIVWPHLAHPKSLFPYRLTYDHILHPGLDNLSRLRSQFHRFSSIWIFLRSHFCTYHQNYAPAGCSCRSSHVRLRIRGCKLGRGSVLRCYLGGVAHSCQIPAFVFSKLTYDSLPSVVSRPQMHPKHFWDSESSKKIIPYQAEVFI